MALPVPHSLYLAKKDFPDVRFCAFFHDMGITVGLSRFGACS